MSLFEPIGEKARWRYVYDLLRQVNDGVVTYERMGTLLHLDPVHHRHTIQTAVHRAAREYEEVDKRALEAIRNIGYRIVEAPEHMRLARRQQTRAQSALQSGRSKVINVDFSKLDPEARKAFEVVATGFAYMLDINRRLDVRQRRIEDAVRSITEGQSRGASDVAALRVRLERLEALALTEEATAVI